MKFFSTKKKARKGNITSSQREEDHRSDRGKILRKRRRGRVATSVGMAHCKKSGSKRGDKRRLSIFVY